jgi:hypothetical protein
MKMSMDKPVTQQQEQANPRLPARGVCLSSLATSKAHGEDSPYFDGWKEYDANPYHPTDNPSGIIQMGLAENQVDNLTYIFIFYHFSYTYVLENTSECIELDDTNHV